MLLTQQEADRLLSMRKFLVDQSLIEIKPGTDQRLQLIGADRREEFLFDIWRSAARLSKVRFQTRARVVVVLARLDINGPPHTNPDGTKLGGTHLHVYREGYESRWAYPLDSERFRDPNNVVQTLIDFWVYCCIEGMPPIQGGLSL